MRAFTAILGIAGLGLLAPLALAATDIVVGRTDDRFDPACVSACSLREAIFLANRAVGPVRVILPAGTYRLTLNDPRWNPDEEPDSDEDDGVRGDLDVAGELALVGVGEERVSIEGSGNRLIEVLPGASLTLLHLTLSDGFARTYGGALLNHGETYASRVSFLDNRATPGIEGKGGAIANFATLSVSHALFQGNNSNGDEGFLGLGGAIYNVATLWVRDTTFIGNSVTDNDVDYARGGAIYNSGTADVARSSFVDNRAGEYSGGGGGSAIANGEQGIFTLTNSTISGNLGTEVNGVVANGISAYTPTGSEAFMRLANVTIAGNGGLGLSNIGQLLVRNSLVAGNSLGGVPANCANAGEYKALGLLLGSDQGNCASDVPVDDALTFSEVIHPLAHTGTRTRIHPLRQGSPALDAGLGSCTSHDQRGLSRPRDGDGDGVAVCDLGAYERAKP